MTHSDSFQVRSWTSAVFGCFCNLVGCALSILAFVVVARTHSLTSFHTVPLLAIVLLVIGYFVQGVWIVLRYVPVAVSISDHGIEVKCLLGHEAWAWEEIESFESVSSQRGRRCALFMKIPKRTGRLRLTSDVFGRSIEEIEALVALRFVSSRPPSGQVSER
jgi:hypothetical protein